ncbi:MAG TPA: helix-turn-helix transcriptional regulator [Micromonosporaceae bacterium]|nr:helix-turn-helix transcriptional regulator [Micromonosporaceae bacterium]
MTDDQVGAVGQVAGFRASDLIASQLKQLRARRNLTVKELAARCQEIGGRDMTANVLTNIEVRRRDVSADELLLLALALDVAPVHLLTPAPGATGGLAVTADVVADPEAAALWIRGDAALLPSRATAYLEYAAERAGPAGRGTSDHAAAVLRARAAGLAAQYETEAQHFLTKVRQQVTDLVHYLHDSVTSGVPSDDLADVLESVKLRVQPSPSALTPSTHPGGRRESR